MHYAIVLNENPHLLKKIVIETDPVFVEFEFVALQINIHSLGYRLLHVYRQVVLLERLNYKVVCLLRVEKSVCVYVFEILGSVVKGKEIIDIGIQTQINAIGIFIIAEVKNNCGHFLYFVVIN
jgi:hypothetical protein